MSNSDQAKSKLLDSMRMSKQGSTKPAPAKKPASTQAAATKPVPAKTSNKPAGKSSSTAKKSKSTDKIKMPDNFQRTQRVWPD